MTQNTQIRLCIFYPIRVLAAKFSPTGTFSVPSTRSFCASLLRNPRRSSLRSHSFGCNGRQLAPFTLHHLCQRMMRYIRRIWSCLEWKEDLRGREVVAWRTRQPRTVRNMESLRIYSLQGTSFLTPLLANVIILHVLQEYSYKFIEQKFRGTWWMAIFFWNSIVQFYWTLNGDTSHYSGTYCKWESKSFIFAKFHRFLTAFQNSCVYVCALPSR